MTMRSDQAVSKILYGMLGALLLLSLFAAPALMAARSTAEGPDEHTADLIRLHQRAVSPYPSAPHPQGEVARSGSCEQLPGDAAAIVEEGVEPSRQEEAAPDQTMIRQVGTRAKRIKV